MRRGTIVLFTVISIPILSIGYCNLYNYQLKSRIDNVRIGQSKKDIYKQIGPPSWDDVCFNPKNNIYGKESLRQKNLTCQSEMGYNAAFFGFPDGSYYLVWFDEHDRVIDTGEIHSP